MLIVGAKGFAKELLEVQYQLDQLEDLVFFDNINLNTPDTLYDTFPVLRSFDEAKDYFKTVDSKFALGLGNPSLRKKMYDAFTKIGGTVTTTMSSQASIGHYGVTIGKGCNIMDFAMISSNVSVGHCTLVYYHAVITHDVTIGDYVEISPSASLLGRCQVGNYSQIGSHATILPDVRLGTNVVVGAGAVVTEDVPDNTVVAGVPAKKIKSLEPLAF